MKYVCVSLGVLCFIGQISVIFVGIRIFFTDTVTMTLPYIMEYSLLGLLYLSISKLQKAASNAFKFYNKTNE